MATKKRLGGLAPKYRFMLNPYPELRLTSCPICRRKTGQRKVPLLIHVHPRQLIALGYTCRYCERCDMLIAHKDKVEHLLHDLFSQAAPEAIGNDYVIIGTVEKDVWRRGMRHPQTIKEILSRAHAFKHSEELRMTRGGWWPRAMEPPVWDPPELREWVKGRAGPARSE